MTDQELLQAIGQLVEAKLEPVRQDIRELKESARGLDAGMDRLELRMKQLEVRVGRMETRTDRLEFGMDRLESGIKQLEIGTDKLEEKVHGIHVYVETDQKRTLNLLLEGQKALWDRFVPQEEFEPLEDRTEILELTVKRHSQEIRELQLA